MRKKGFGDIMNIFGLFMALIYVGLGLYLLFTPYFPDIPKTVRMTFCIFFIMYGIFRFVRVYLKYKNDRDYEE
jgi:hypothetical protein